MTTCPKCWAPGHYNGVAKSKSMPDGKRFVCSLCGHKRTVRNGKVSTLRGRPFQHHQHHQENSHASA